MFNYGKRRSNPPIKVMGTKGFSLGLNQLTHPSAIKNNELAEAFNVEYTQNGVIKKRPGYTVIGEAKADETKILSLKRVYNIGSPPLNYTIRIGTEKKAQKYDYDLKLWTDIASSPTFSELYKTYIIQGMGYVFFFNYGNIVARWNGSAWTTYSTLTDPANAPTVEKQGSGTGVRTYYYKYVWFNAIGHTKASASANVASMPEKLDTSTWIKVTMPDAPANTVETAIYRGNVSGSEFYLTSLPAAEKIYNDKGALETDPTYLYPNVNTTSGYKFKFATTYKDSIIGVTAEEGNDTIVFSGAGPYFGNFGNTQGIGGGFYMWGKDEGTIVKSMHPFKEQLYVFKSNKVGIFDFTTATEYADSTVKEINLSMGAVSFDSVHVAGNDLRGWSKDGAFSLGNEPNFADVVRTKILSARIKKTTDSITHSNMDKIVSAYYNNLSLWAIPTGTSTEGNTILAVYDERYSAWSIWTGIKASVFAKIIEPDNKEYLYYGDDISGNVYKMFDGLNDNGSPINFRVSTKQYDANLPYKYKTFGKVYYIFGLISGSGTRLVFIENGSKASKTFSLISDLTVQGMGIDQWGSVEWGDSTSDEVSQSSGIIVRYADVGNRDLFSLQTQIYNSGLKDQIEFVGYYMEYSDSEQPLSSRNRLQRI